MSDLPAARGRKDRGMGRGPGAALRATHVLVCLLIFGVLAGGTYAALLALGNPTAEALAALLSSR